MTLQICKLMFVDITKDKTTGKEVQSNKFYDMFEQADGTYNVVYGRVGAAHPTKLYGIPMSKWHSTIKSKTKETKNKKGYEDVTHLLTETVVTQDQSGNAAFDAFYDHFSNFCRNAVKNTYISSTATKKQIDEAQDIVNQISSAKTEDAVNELLKRLYRVIPRVMGDIRDYLIKNISEKNTYIQKEQDALDSMDSSNIIHTTNVLSTLGVTFRDVTTEEMKEIKDCIEGSNTSSYRIHKAYRVENPTTQALFDSWVAKQKDKTCKLLIHGTRNPNIFSIMKQGLLIRPSNAATISGAAYGEGVYHSAHTDKSLGYTGREKDAIFFLQNVHMGREYTYSGWYRDGKGLDRNDMTYKGLQKRDCDSLYVKAGDGLLNSEYIVFNSPQTTIKYIVWFKRNGY